jgi:hypothetical protein
MSTISASTTSTTAFKITTDTTGALVFQTGASPTTAVTFDASQNVGIGVTPSAWTSSSQALQNGSGALWKFTGSIYLGQNYYFNGTNRIYITSDYATEYEQRAGQHRWFNAISGTAGGAISFTQAMTLDASSRLLVGTTSSSNNAKIEAAGTLVSTNQTIATFTTDQAGVDFNTSTKEGRFFTTSTTSSGTIGLYVGGGTKALAIDSAGNVGVGVTTPSSWASTLTGTIENRSGGMYPYNPGGGAYDMGIFVNAYYDGTWRYKNSSSSAAYFLSATNASTSTLIRHVWRSAGAGTAGAAITYNDSMYLDAGGRRLNPLQTGFSVVQMSVTDFNASTGSSACLKGGTVSYNQGSGYDSTTGRFTAPVAGTYVVTSAILVATGTGRMEAALYINGGQYVAMNGTGTTYDGPGLSVVVKLAQSDFLTIGRISGSAYTSPHTNTYFSAYLLG